MEKTLLDSMIEESLGMEYDASGVDGYVVFRGKEDISAEGINKTPYVYFDMDYKTIEANNVTLTFPQLCLLKHKAVELKIDSPNEKW